MRAFKSALISIRRSPYQALASVLLLTVTSILVFSLSFLMVGAQLILKYYEAQPQVVAFINIDTLEEEVSQVISALEEKSYIASVNYTNQDQALEIYKEAYATRPRLLELVTPQMLPASLELNATDISSLAQIKKDLLNFPIIDEVILQEDVIATFATITNFMRIIGIIFAGLMAFLSFLIIMIVISMKMQSKRATIFTQRLLGASKYYVTAPYMIEGIIYGFLGGMIGWGIVVLSVFYFAPTIQEYIREVKLYPIDVFFLLYQALIGIGLCMLIGMIAGQVAANRMMKRI